MSEQRYIYVKFQKEGIHRYPAAAEDPKLVDVSFLAHPHRHIFHFVVGIQVFHDDREIEFVQFKRWLESLYELSSAESALQLNYKSCEMLCDELCEVIRRRYPNRAINIDISEDNENGAVLYSPCMWV